MPSWKKLIVSGSDAQVKSLYVTNHISASDIHTNTLDVTGSGVINDLTSSNILVNTLDVTSSANITELTGSNVLVTSLTGSSANITNFTGSHALLDDLRVIYDITGSNALLSGSLQVDAVKFNPAYSASNLPTGSIYWDSHDETVVIKQSNNKTQNLGEEVWVPLCWNNSGTTIYNGDPVRISGTSNDRPTVDLASNKEYETSRMIGVATEDIAPGTLGRVTRFGYVNDVDLSGFNLNDVVYLGRGVLTNVRPTGGDFPVTIGKVIKNTVNGILLVYPDAVDTTTEVDNTKGFASYIQGDQSTMTFDSGTRTFTIAPVTGSDCRYYYQGFEHVITSSRSYQITADEGIHTLYCTGSGLVEKINPTVLDVFDIYDKYVPVTTIYWDATNNQAIHFANQRHTFEWPGSVLAYTHLTNTTRYFSGLAPNGITIGNGQLAAHAQFGIDSGTIVNEDVHTTIPYVSSSVGLPVYYRTGSAGAWRREFNPGFSVLNDPVTGLVQYNSHVGGVWAKTSITNNNYGTIHVFAINELSPHKTIAVMGLGDYDSVAAAEAAVDSEIAIIAEGDLPYIIGAKHICTFLFITKASIQNIVDMAIEQTVDGYDYLDYRTSYLSGGSGYSSAAVSFVDLLDTPSSYATYANSLTQVSPTETGLQYSGLRYDTNRDLFDSASIHSIQAQEFTGSLKGNVDATSVTSSFADIQNLTVNSATGSFTGSFKGSVDATDITSPTATITSISSTDVNATSITGSKLKVDYISEKTPASTVNFLNDLTATQNLTVTGNLTVNGTQFIANTQTVNITDNILLINNGETGAGVTSGSAGIEVDRGTLTNYQFVFDEVTDTFRVGEAGTLQAVATRENTPLNGGFAYWDSSAFQFKTKTISSSDLTDTGNLAKLDSVNIFGSSGFTGQMLIGLRQSTNLSNGWYLGYGGSTTNDLVLYAYENAKFSIYTNTGLSAEFNTDHSLKVYGNVNTTGQYQVNGSQISSTNLSDNSNLAKRDNVNNYSTAQIINLTYPLTLGSGIISTVGNEIYFGRNSLNYITAPSGGSFHFRTGANTGLDLLGVSESNVVTTVNVRIQGNSTTGLEVHNTSASTDPLLSAGTSGDLLINYTQGGKLRYFGGGSSSEVFTVDTAGNSTQVGNLVVSNGTNYQYIAQERISNGTTYRTGINNSGGAAYLFNSNVTAGTSIGLLRINSSGILETSPNGGTNYYTVWHAGNSNLSTVNWTANNLTSNNLLTINGPTSTATLDGVTLSFQRTNANYIWASNTGGYLLFGVNGNTQGSSGAGLYINTSNNVFIPNGNLYVGYATAPNNARMSLASPSTATYTLGLGRYSGQPSIKSTETYLIMDSNGAPAALNWFTSDNVILAQGGGDVIIGTGAASTAYKFDVRGDAAVNTQVTVRNSSSTSGFNMVWNDTSKSIDFTFN